MPKILLFLFFILFFCQSAWSSDVSVQKTPEGQWNLFVDGIIYFIKGVDYRITKIGQSPDVGNLKDWAWYDYNHNSLNDCAYDSWVDKNWNNVQDADEKVVGDFELMRQMGVNTIRWYVNDFKDQRPNKQLLRDLYKKYGIRVAVGNKFGAYTIDSGANWSEGTDYRDPRQQARILESVRRMVLEHKDEPYTLLWLLGNENNLRFTNTNAGKFPDTYAEFLEKAAKLIRELDGRHPVALVNGDAQFLTTYHKYCVSVDIFGANVYRGPNGFGSLWKEVQKNFNRPVLITEYGGSYAPGLDQDTQAAYHKGCWLDIERNRAGGKGVGNSIGGFAFEFLDEWWKAGDPGRQAKKGTTGQVGVDNPRWTQEYCGVISQGNGKHSPFLRQLRKVYFVYKDLWSR
jgi:beta-glucuronidase